MEISQLIQEATNVIKKSSVSAKTRKVVNMYKSGRSIETIKKELNYDTKSAVLYHLKKAGIEINPEDKEPEFKVGDAVMIKTSDTLADNIKQFVGKMGKIIQVKEPDRYIVLFTVGEGKTQKVNIGELSLKKV